MLYVLGMAAALLMAGCQPPTSLAPIATAIPQETSSPTLDWYSIYFTNPAATDAGKYRGGPDTHLAAAIDQAQVSVDVAIYDLNLWSIRDALVAAQQRGVNVRFVTESDNLDEPEIHDLQAAGIPVLGDRREGLMHNKFVVIDEQEVWTGSMNYTTTDGYLNDNHLARLRSDRLAEIYTSEFNEMFVDDRFGPDAGAALSNPGFRVNQTEVEVYFSPEDGTAQRLAELISGARSSVVFLAFSFTSDLLAEAMLERASQGVVVMGVFEEAQVTSNIGSQYAPFLERGIDVRLDSNPRNMHHKVIVIDEQIVVIGSYNFSSSAERRNDENTVILHNPHIAALFVQEFQRIFAQAHR